MFETFSKAHFIEIAGLWDCPKWQVLASILATRHLSTSMEMRLAGDFGMIVF
jgi:hypothetical protein